MTRTHGGAVLRGQVERDLPLTQRELAHQEEKRCLCRRAAAFIEDGDVLFLDISSTTLPIIGYIPDNIHVTILTNSLEVANEYLRRDKENVVVVCTGGIVRRANRSLTGYLSQYVLNEFNPRKAFLSCYGLSMRDGFTEGNIYDAEIKRLIVEKSNRSFFLIDHSKIGEVGPVRLGPLSFSASTRCRHRRERTRNGEAEFSEERP